MAAQKESLLNAVGRSLNPGMLSGITFSTWLKILRQRRYRIHPTYLPRALSITASSMMNSVVGAWEQRRYGDQWADIEPEPPIVVVGVARSGTTFLHNLISTNPRFAYPSILEARYPLSFVTLGGPLSVLTHLLLGGKRAQDGVAFGPDVPAEDSSALIALGVDMPALNQTWKTGGGAVDQSVPSDEEQQEAMQTFVDAFRWFSRKLTWRHKKRLVFKNPAYVSRLPALLHAAPGAKIVFIHRHPYDTINSGIHAWDRVHSYRQLEKREPHPPEQSLQGAGRGIRNYLGTRALVPQGNLVELAYADVVSQPIAALEKAYSELGIEGFEEGLPALEHHVNNLRSYHKNRHPELPGHLRRMVQEEFPEWFTSWGYSR